jgi:cobalamin-dependent methionine synthase I
VHSDFNHLPVDFCPVRKRFYSSRCPVRQASANKNAELIRKFSGVKITSGLSDISFGLPLRKPINRNFLCLTMYEEINSAILDSTDKEIRGTLFAVDVLAAKDKNCRKFISAFRMGKL